MIYRTAISIERSDPCILHLQTVIAMKLSSFSMVLKALGHLELTRGSGLIALLLHRDLKTIRVNTD